MMKKMVFLRNLCLLGGLSVLVLTSAAFGATTLTAVRTLDTEYFTNGTSIAVTIAVTPADGKTTSAVVTEIVPEGFTASVVDGSYSGKVVIDPSSVTWTLSNASAKTTMTYTLTAPASDSPLYTILSGTVDEGATSIDLGNATLKHEPGLGPKWVLGTGSGVWAVMDGVLRSYADTGSDPKHIWVDLDLKDGNYTVICDCRIVNWEDNDHARAGVAIRINPDDNGNNVGSDRGICLLFHNDTNSVDLLNDLTAWGPLTDLPWVVGDWYTFALSGFDDTTIDAYFLEKGVDEPMSGAAYLNSWFDDALANRSPGFPGLTASTLVGLEVEFDNFKVIDSTGKVVFEDDFERVETAPLTTSRTIESVNYTPGSTITGINVTVKPAAGHTSSAVITETLPANFTVTNVQTNHGTTSISGNTLTWKLDDAAAKVEMTYDLIAPTANAPLVATITGKVVEGEWEIPLTSVSLKIVSNLGAPWVIGAGGGVWVVSDGILRVFSDSAIDPKHAWVDLGLDDGDYTVVCDCRMASWQNADLARAGIAIRINPDDNGNNVGSDRGLCLLFHNDMNSVDLLNDKTSWGTLTDIAWELNTWYSMALVGTGSTVDGYFIGTGEADALSDDAYLSSWTDDALATRSPGFPGLAASSYNGLEAQFDNFKVLDASGNVIFEDNFDQATVVPEWSLY